MLNWQKVAAASGDMRKALCVCRSVCFYNCFTHVTVQPDEFKMKLSEFIVAFYYIILNQLVTCWLCSLNMFWITSSYSRKFLVFLEST